jgi:putative membrane protein
MRAFNRVGLVIAVIGLSSVALANEPLPPTGTTPAGTAPTGTEPATEPASPSGQDASGTAANRPQMDNYDDAQVVGMLNAISKAEIEMSKAVLAKTKNPEVKRFAQTMIDDHNMLLQKTQTWSKTTGTREADSRMSTEYQGEAKSGMSKMSGYSGEELDRHYVEHAVQSHQRTLDLVDAQMMNQIDDPQLKTLVRDVRPKLQRHLESAQTLRTSLRGDSQDDRPTDDTPSTDDPSTTPRPSPNPEPTPSPTPEPMPDPTPTPNPTGF